VRELARQAQAVKRDPTDRAGHADVFGPYAPWLNHADPSIVANTVMCLIHQANYLLDQQIAALERAFVSEGGYTERLAAARIAERERKQALQDPAANADSGLPNCPLCGKPMVIRTARKGQNACTQFWGCASYPSCKGTRPVEVSNNRSDPTDRSDQVREKPRARPEP